ncbi:MAG TPA: hypothetical protein VM328_00925 [Fimbriimonadaceae bacterium]|nr:hypothetical protein [Fimbriimonadaceae bacterium]
MAVGPDRYDPSEIDERPSNAYFSRRDIRNLVIAFLVLLALSYPAYRLLLGLSERHVCAKNLGQVSKALGLYLIDNNDRFPAMFESGPGGGPAVRPPTNRPFTWNSVIFGYVSDADAAVYRCPTATSAEQALVQHPQTNAVGLAVTYGLYAPYSGFSRYLVPNPDGTIIIAETSNFGARNTFDPLKFLDENGRPIPYDAFSIGFDNHNFYPDSSSQFLTRLAFPDSAGGDFGANAGVRHGSGTHALTVAGRLLRLDPPAARIRRTGNEIHGLWAVPPVDTSRDYSGR